MKKSWFFLGVFLTLVPLVSTAAQTAQARMYCRSLRFQQSTDDNSLFTLDLSTLTSGNNGELGPYFYFFNPSTTHSAYLHLVDQLFFDDYLGAMDLNVPSGGDANGNGYADFFEVSQGISASSSGTYSISGLGSGSVTASWFRSAGSQFGACTLTFHNTSFGNIVFAATYELIEYTGPLTYTPGSNTVSGSVNLSQTGNSANTLQGPATFVKTSADHFNALNLQPGGWTNAATQTLIFSTNLFSRDLTRLTNYSGYVVFDDGDPNTGEPDYWLWILSIDDTNDADHDGIPDFSDDPASSLPRRPVLTLTRGTTNLSLKISGDVGHAHQILETTNLATGNWTTNLSLTLTNDPQTVSLPLPTSPKFWRAQAQ